MTKAKVLVIDDEEMIRWAIQRTLSAAGYEVAVAETGAEGMALFHQFVPQVVFLDIRLPDQHGLTVLKEMNEKHGPKTAVVVMTAFGESRTAAEALRLGAFQYLKKPFDFDTLDALVAQALHATKPCVRSSRGPD